MKNRVRWYAYFEEDRPFALFPTEGIYYWRPCILKTRLIDGCWVDEDEEVFKGYCFVGSVNGWQFIEQTLEICLLRDNGKPHEFSESELRHLRYFAQVQYNLMPEKFVCGEIVRVAEGSGSAFAGLKAKFVRTVPTVGGEQACVELDLFGQRTIFHCVPLDHLVRR